MFHKLVLFILIISLCPSARAQALETNKGSKPDEKAETIRTQAAAYLREAMAEANNLRSLENRISFTSELAGLMWYSDEREARSMFNAVIGDFRELLMRYDSQMNAIGMGPVEADHGSGFLGDLSDKSRLSRKFSTAMAVRQQIAMSIAEHDAEMAFNFYYDSRSLVSSPEFVKQSEARDTFFENQLIMAAINGKSPKAAQFATKSLEKGVNSQHVELLKKITENDPEKGAEFGAAILSKLKSDKIALDNFYAVSALLSFGDQNLTASRTDGTRPVYSQSDLRDIAEIFAQAIIDTKPGQASNSALFASAIEKYAPGRAAQIRSRQPRGTSAPPPRRAGGRTYPARGSGSAAANTSYYEGEYSGEVITTAANSAPNLAREEREDLEEKTMQDVMSLSGKELPKAEREKIVTQARRIISETPGREKKVTALSLLAGQVAKAGDKELASDIMKDAAAFVNPYPKNYQDFIFTWMLAAGYAAADPDKAFPLLDDTISRANTTIDAFVRVAEFIDVTGEMVDDGEVQVGAFGGSMMRGLTGGLGMADETIKMLAHADFAKTCGLANRFDRPEVRMLAKMLVLRAVLNDKDRTARESNAGN